MFSMICEKVITQHIRKVRAASDRKMAGVFAADILTKGQINPNLWGNLLEEVIALFELPIEEGDNEFQEGVCEGKIFIICSHENIMLFQVIVMQQRHLLLVAV